MTFAYQQAASLAEAAKAAAAADAKLLAGGQSLLGAIKLGLAAPESLVDLRAANKTMSSPKRCAAFGDA